MATAPGEYGVYTFVPAYNGAAGAEVVGTYDPHADRGLL